MFSFSLSITLCCHCLCASATSYEILQDKEMQHGFCLSAVRSSATPVEIRTVLARDTTAPPRWRLAQWGTRFSLEDTPEQQMPGGIRILENAAKKVHVHPSGVGGEGILLDVQGSTEYGGRLRAYGEAWPHLLIEQKLDDVALKQFQSLQFSITFKVITCTPEPKEPLDPGLHTAHITAFWTIHNLNPESPDFQDMIWFGIPLFDARYPLPLGHQALDVGQEDATGKFICSISGDRIFDHPVAVGEEHKIQCDLLPFMREALEAAQSNQFLTNTVLKDLALTSFNLGWEVPGPYNCSIVLRGLSILATPILSK